MSIKVKKVSFFFLSVFILLNLVACNKEAAKATHLNAQEAKNLLDQQNVTIVLDVRTPEEYQAGHIKDSRLINFKNAGFESQLAELDRNLPYLVHCKSGGRSGKSIKLMSDMGFTKIYHLDGGFDSWQQSGFPISK